MGSDQKTEMLLDYSKKTLFFPSIEQCPKWSSLSEKIETGEYKRVNIHATHQTHELRALENEFIQMEIERENNPTPESLKGKGKNAKDPVDELKEEWTKKLKASKVQTYTFVFKHCNMQAYDEYRTGLSDQSGPSRGQILSRTGIYQRVFIDNLVTVIGCSEQEYKYKIPYKVKQEAVLNYLVMVGGGDLLFLPDEEIKKN